MQQKGVGPKQGMEGAAIGQFGEQIYREAVASMSGTHQMTSLGNLIN